MERLEGTDLGQLIKRRSLLSSHEIREIVHQVAAALDAAHAAGIIHRDLKPNNVFGTHEPRVWKLLDFGASRWADGQGTLTRRATSSARPATWRPSRRWVATIDHRADIYAFGALLYRLVTGVPAVVPADVPVMLQEVSYRMPVQPRARAPQVSEQVEAVLAIALAKRNLDDLLPDCRRARRRVRSRDHGHARAAAARARRNADRGHAMGPLDRRPKNLADRQDGALLAALPREQRLLPARRERLGLCLSDRGLPRSARLRQHEAKVRALGFRHRGTPWI